MSLGISAQLGYPVLFGLVAAESTGVPVPGETALITAGVLAHSGRLNIELVITIAAVAAIVGDNTGYVIGRTGGRRLLERPGFAQHHRRQILEKGERFFDRHGSKAVFLGRWVAGLRITAAWLAGANRMPWPIFLFWNALGGIAWAVSVGVAAYLLGPVVGEVLRTLGLGVATLLALLVVAVAGWRWRNRRAARQQPPATAAKPDARR